MTMNSVHRFALENNPHLRDSAELAMAARPMAVKVVLFEAIRRTAMAQNTALRSNDLDAFHSLLMERERLIAQGSEPLTGSPDDLRRHLAHEIEVWGKVIREAGIRVE